MKQIVGFTRSKVVLWTLVVTLLGVASVSVLGAQEIEPVTLLPGTVDVSPEVEQAVRRALSEAQDITATRAYAITDVRIEEDWQLVSVIGLEGVGADHNWNLLDHGAWFGLVIVQRDAVGAWQGAVEGTPAFSQMLGAVPETIVSAAAKRELDPRTRQTETASYRFPWTPGTRMKYGSLGVHDNGFRGVTSGWKAVDFLSDGNQAVGHAPNLLRAAASGVIGYRCTPHSGQNTTAVKIGNLMYTHLFYNVDLSVGRSIEPGEVLGTLRPGEFYENCGYAYQQANWFHVHLGFPNSGSITFENWTLDIASGLWRAPNGEVRGTGAWFEALCCAETTIVINEIDTGVDDAIELYNFGDMPVDLAGWRVKVYNGNTLDVDYVVPEGVMLPAHAYIVLCEGNGSNTSNELFIGESISWANANASGAAALIKDEGIDFVRFGGSSVAAPGGTGWHGSNPGGPPSGRTLSRDILSSDTGAGRDWASHVSTLGRVNADHFAYVSLVINK